MHRDSVHLRLPSLESRGRSLYSARRRRPLSRRGPQAAISGNVSHDSKRLFSECRGEDAVVCRQGEPDNSGNKRYLRADTQNDILFDPLVGMNPTMKSLKGPQRFMREVGMNEVEGIGEHGPEGAEQD